MNPRSPAPLDLEPLLRGGLHDILLPLPFGEALGRFLLFVAFYLHFAFVLAMLGTAMLGVLDRLWRTLRRLPDGEDTAGGALLRSFFVHKSLAVVLGVGALIVFTVANPVPFLMGVGTAAPLWLSLVLILLTALFLLEVLAERKRPATPLTLASGVAGLVLLWLTAGTFVLALVSTENPAAWRTLDGAGGRLTPPLFMHWALRLLHVLGAAVVFGGVFRYLQLRDRDAAGARQAGFWIAMGVAFQVVGGIPLLVSLPHGVNPAVMGSVVLGVSLAVVLVLRLWRGPARRAIAPTEVAMYAAGLLAAMLLVRQAHQDQALRPMQAVLADAAAVRRQRLAGSRDPIPALTIAPTSNAMTSRRHLALYDWSCGFCHGGPANGRGVEAVFLGVPPEDLTMLRAEPEAVRTILRHGVPGTAMPRFTFYTEDEQDQLVTFLHRAGLRDAPEPPARSLPPSARDEARAVYVETCQLCHGPDGTGTPLSATFRPSPPDLTRISFAAPRLFQVISEGYPGTRMPAFSHLRGEVRWGLVERVVAFHRSARE